MENVVCPPNMELVVLLVFPNGDWALVVDMLVPPKSDATDVSIAALAAPNNEDAQVLTAVGVLNMFCGVTFAVELGVPNTDPVLKEGNDGVICWGVPNTDTWVVGVCVGEMVRDDTGAAGKTDALEGKLIVVVVGVNAEMGAVVEVGGISGALAEPKEIWPTLFSIGIAIVSDVIGMGVLIGSDFFSTLWLVDFVRSVGNGLLIDMDTFGGTIYKPVDLTGLKTELVVVVTGLSLSFCVDTEGIFRVKLLIEDVILAVPSNVVFWEALPTTFDVVFVRKTEFEDATLIEVVVVVIVTGCCKSVLISVLDLGGLTGGIVLEENVVLDVAENADEMAGAKLNEKFLRGAVEAGFEKFITDIGGFVISTDFGVSFTKGVFNEISFLSDFTEESAVNPVTGEGVNTLKEDSTGIVGVFELEVTAVGTTIDGEDELGKLILLHENGLSSPDGLFPKIFWNMKAVEVSET